MDTGSHTRLSSSGAHAAMFLKQLLAGVLGEGAQRFLQVAHAIKDAPDELACLLGNDVGVRLGLKELLHLGVGKPLRGFRSAGKAD